MAYKNVDLDETFNRFSLWNDMPYVLVVERPSQ
jgi:hypothetical protein